MTKSITKVRPIFKIDIPDEEPQIISNKYLYAVELGRTSHMVPGGNFYLGEDGRPRYPKNHEKVKSIQVGEYYFHLSDEPRKKGEFSKFTLADCYQRVKIEKKANQEVLFKQSIPDHVFIMGTDKKGAPLQKRFYQGAENFFRLKMHFPKDWIHLAKDVGKIISNKITFIELLDNILDLKKSFKHIYIVSHSDVVGALIFPFDGTRNERGKLKLTDWYALSEASKNGTLAHRSEMLSKHLTPSNSIRIRGCNIGRNSDMLDLLATFFGGNCTVSAPVHKQVYQYKPVTNPRKAWQLFRTYWVSFPGIVRKKRRDLINAFEELYKEASPKPGNWRSNISKVKRHLRLLPTTNYIYVRHPPPPPEPTGENPALDEKRMENYRRRVTRFARRHWSKNLRDYLEIPRTRARFVRREGPTTRDISGEMKEVYVYVFEDIKTGDMGELWYQLYPSERAQNEMIDEEKTKHSQQEWYIWRMKKTIKGARTHFRVRAVMTIFQIKVPLREESTKKKKRGKLIEAEEPNTAYFGLSQS